MNANFEDHGIFYATQDMINENITLSVNTGILYDITNANDVHIKHYKPSMLISAKKDIKNDNACWYGVATITTGNHTLIWEY